MATLHFKGKSAVWNHHLSVPYQTLDPVAKMSHKGKDEEENLIIEGDNLIALKALLPKYQGKIKCIYIDPPYNTGNEGWVYNDNVNNPIIKSWIGETVGKEGEDLTRHDKWLCMMTPRMKLLRELLANDGIIFVSINDGEFYNLKVLMDDIFGIENFVSTIVWESKTTGGHDSNDINNVHEYVITYKRSDSSGLNKQITNTSYPEYDEAERKSFKWDSLWTVSHGYTKNCDYPIITPDGTEIYPWMCHKKGEKVKGVARWYWNRETYEADKENTIVKKSKDGKWKAYKKVYEGTPISYKSIFLDKSAVGGTSRGKQQLRDLFDEDLFENPKSSDLIYELINIATDKNDIILDSFAGSGTAAQAVLELNKEDGGNRKFILVQIPEETEKDSAAYKAGYKTIQEITQARAKKVIERDGLDVGFTYYKLGQQIDADGILTGDLPNYDDFAKYVYYLATGKNYPTKSKVDEKRYLVGKDEGTALFLVYENNFDKLKSMALTLDLAKDLHKQHEGRKIVYAPACFLDEHHLDQFNITFVGIPFNLFERN